jgi:hypothetical protein
LKILERNRAVGRWGGGFWDPPVSAGGLSEIVAEKALAAPMEEEAVRGRQTGVSENDRVTSRRRGRTSMDLLGTAARVLFIVKLIKCGAAGGEV